MAEAYPLSWPLGVNRTSRRMKSRFGERTIKGATDSLYHELAMLNAKNVVVSSNLPLKNNGKPYASYTGPIDDPGVVAYFTLGGKQYAMPCDRWDKVEDNFWAVSRHINAMRGQLRWGVASVEQAFAGFKALPERSGGESCWDVLGIEQGAGESTIKDAYRRLAKELHPDLGGSDGGMTRLNLAKEAALQTALGVGGGA